MNLMFSSVLIKNYKNISSLEVEKLANVNLFFGKNNCGKSTLLESIFLMSGVSNPELLMRCNYFRGYKHLNDFSFFFHNLITKQPIELESKSELSDFRRKSVISYHCTEEKTIIPEAERNSISNSNLTSFLDVSFSIANGPELKSRLSLEKNEGKEIARAQVPSLYREKIVCNYLAPVFSFETIPIMVSNVVKDKQEKIVVDALRMIDSRIKDFTLFQNEVLVDVGMDKRIPINLLGDGVRKFFTLVLAIYSSRDGILIVDEIDNGLHFSSMESLWNIIFNISIKFNVQMFITTHNVDSLKGLQKVLKNNESYKDKLSLYKLIHNSSDINKAVYYDAKSFSAVIEQENEIR